MGHDAVLEVQVTIEFVDNAIVAEGDASDEAVVPFAEPALAKCRDLGGHGACVGWFLATQSLYLFEQGVKVIAVSPHRPMSTCSSLLISSILSVL